MAYFSNDFVRFFEELEKNNHKEWFLMRIGNGMKKK